MLESLPFVPKIDLAAVKNVNQLASVTGIKLDLSLFKIYRQGKDTTPNSSQDIARLTIPWSNVEGVDEPFRLLHWSAQQSELFGRKDEWNQLDSFMREPDPVRIKFIWGEGGTGKTRLAAQFAQAWRIQHPKWEAGFVHLRDLKTYPFGEQGAIFLVDYPEQHPSSVEQLLRYFHDCPYNDPGSDLKLRVFFLTRQPPLEWDAMLHDTQAVHLLSEPSIQLKALDVEDAVAVYDSGHVSIAKSVGKPSSQTEGEKLDEWLNAQPVNRRALFTLSLAARDVFEPSERFDFNIKKVIDALAKREWDRLRRLGNEYPDTHTDGFARLLAMAVICNGVSFEQTKIWAELDAAGEQSLGLGLGDPAKLFDRLKSVHLISNRNRDIEAPAPDSVAAVFAARIFSSCEDCSEMVWHALHAGDFDTNLKTFIRVDNDLVELLSTDANLLRTALEYAVKGKPGRCEEFMSVAEDPQLPSSLLPASRAVWNTMLEGELEDPERARFLLNLSSDLILSGDYSSALTANQASVDISRKLAEQNPVEYRPKLATNLNNLSLCLRGMGETQKSLEVAKEALKIREELAIRDPKGHLPDFAQSLQNMSDFLTATGDPQGGLSQIQLATAIYRSLVDDGHEEHLPDLAMCLINQFKPLRIAGDSVNMLRTTQEAISIFRQLVVDNPVVYTPFLFYGLNNLSIYYGHVGNSKEQIDITKEAIVICRKLSRDCPAMYKFYLAQNLNSLSNCLTDSGDLSGARAAVKESVDIWRELVIENTDANSFGLAVALFNLGNCYINSNELVKARKLFVEASEYWKPTAEVLPNSEAAKLYKVAIAVISHLDNHTSSSDA